MTMSNYNSTALLLTGLLPIGLAFATTQDQEPVRDTLPSQLPTEIPLGLPPELDAKNVDEAVLALGRRLFFDPILSADRSINCASCHDPSHGFSDTKAKSTGVFGRQTLRNSPTLFNRALGEAFFWDGRAATLEEQVVMPIENDLEMGLPLADAIARLTDDPGYVAGFEAAFRSKPSRDGLATALAGFVRRIWRGNSALDRFRQGEHDAFTPAERGGLWFFESRGGCWRCHSGSNLTDEDFHNTGVGVVEGMPEEGRMFVTQNGRDRGAFKTPTLRGVPDTAPYMHDGGLETLEDVVEFYRKGGHPNAGLDAKIKPLEMSDKDVANLVAFLKSL